MGRQLYEVLVTPTGGGKGRPLLVFLHGYGATPSDTLSPAFVTALRRLGDRAPVVLLPEGDTGWWHDRDEGPWGSYVLREAIPAALRRSGADRDRVAIGGISMGGFGALDLGRTSRRSLLRGRRPLAGGLRARQRRHRVRLRQRRRLRPPRPDSRSPANARPTTRRSGSTSATRTRCGRRQRSSRASYERHGADVSFHVWPGSHDGDYWDAHFAQYLRFYADACD